MDMTQEAIFTEIENIAAQVAIDPKLLKAIAAVESSFNPMAVRYEPAFKYTIDIDKHAFDNKITHDTEEILQKCSWGLCQIMGATARSLGYKKELPRLGIASIGLYWSALYLKQLIKRFPNNNDYISAYNAGSPTSKNQSYVTKVLAHYEVS